MVGRVEVEANDVADLLDEEGIGRELEVLLPAGQSHSNLDLEQVVVVPAGLLASGGDAALGRGLAAQEVEDQAAQDRHVVGGMAGTDAAFVLPEGHSKTQCRRFSTPQWLRTARSRARASAGRLEM